MDSYEIRDWILAVLGSRKNVIRQEAFLDINHYVEHTEYAMAYEYLLLELMESDSCLCEHRSEVLCIGLALGLDQDYHYDENFWRKLENFCAQTDLEVDESKH
ncbi:hypothetical protein Pstr01_37740 [Pseudomonas straminea]|nr:hypothetical protein [Pseudomonas straminea]GLX15535.1 hypothetical protein Pstr01_37740 [Pseudomonas straminea]